MRTHLRFWLVAFSAIICLASHAQVTLVSDNTNLSGGYVLPNGIPLLISDSGALYTTNGATATVITTNVIFNNDSGSAVVYKGLLYFTGSSSSGDIELWETDGTASNTKEIANISAGGSSNPNSFFVFNGLLYFTADDGVHGRELWKTDGSVNNASLVSDINGTPAGSFDDNTDFFLQNGSNVFFTAVSNGVTGLYKLTASGVTLIKNDFVGDVSLFPAINAANIGSRTIFTVDTTDENTQATTLQVWATDGTTGGTQVLHTFTSGFYISSLITPVLFKGLLYFSYNDTATAAIWTTDGTPGNTQLFKSFDVDPDLSFYGSTITLFGAAINNNTLYFNGYSSAAGHELWSTDGSAANTQLLKDINPGTESSGAAFVFNTAAEVDYIASGNTANVTYQQFITPFNGKLYFTADDGTNGIEMWSTDGTAANTNLVKDINPGGDGVDNGGFNEAYYTASGIYFVADDGTTGDEPWVTDGMAAGTNEVANINTHGANGSDPTYLFIYNNQLYLNASNGGANSDLYKVNQSVSSLPVSLINFAATKQAQSVLLTWTTINEVNASRFTIERSTDGRQFTEVGSAAALNNGAANNRYQFTDMGAMQTGSSVLYYRLKTTDKDGRYVYSPILKVELQNGVFTFTLSPNPVRNRLTVSFSTGGSTKSVLRVVDANGRQLFQQVYATSPSVMQQAVDVSRYAAGTYLLQLVTDTETRTLKFVKE